VNYLAKSLLINSTAILTLCSLLVISLIAGALTFSYAANPVIANQKQYSFIRKWGSFGTADGQFENVVGIAINTKHGSDKVYTSNSNGNPGPGSNHRIQEFTKQGKFITKWGTAGSGIGQFVDPFGIAIDSSNNVYVADQVNQRIQKFTHDGTFIRSWSVSVNPTGIAIDSQDNVYVTVQFSHYIAKFTSDGALIKTWGTQGTGNGQFEYPRGIAIDTSDNVYVTDLIPNTLTYRVQKFSSEGMFITSWGSLGSGSTSLQFNGYGIAIDTSSNNDVFVADTFSNRVQKFTSTGTLLTEFGTAGSANGQLDTPHDVALDSSGNVYVADSYNHRIQVFAPTAADGHHHISNEVFANATSVDSNNNNNNYNNPNVYSNDNDSKGNLFPLPR
jgi:NHL repeat-containing protein/6-bladed beta-propeller protein